MIYLKRAYEAPDVADGYRILVDRLWPRGVKMATAQIDCWLKEVAPTTSLRQWFHQEENRFAEFKTAYEKELQETPQAEAFAKLQELVENYPVVTLVYAAKDQEHNQAVVLTTILEKSINIFKDIYYPFIYIMGIATGFVKCF